MNIMIIGGLHHNTLGVVRSIGDEICKDNIDVIIVGKNFGTQNCVSASKYLDKDKIYYVETYNSVIPKMLDIAKDGKIRVVVSCADGATQALLSEKHRLDNCYLIPNTKLDINLLMNKSFQDEIAVKCGFNVPESAVIKKGSSYTWNYFPCILKPLLSTIGSGKDDIHIVDTKDKLVNTIATISADEIHIQKYVDKKMEYQLIGCSLDAGEKIIIPGYTNIIRQPYNTNTGYLLYSPIKEFMFDYTAVKRFIKEIGYSGLFSLEFIRDKNDKDYFLEINMRNDGNAYCVKTAGVNLPYIWCFYQENRTLPENVRTVFDKAIYFMPDFNDFKLGVKAVGIFKWTKQFFKSESHSIYNTEDIKPFWIKLFSYFFR